MERPKKPKIFTVYVWLIVFFYSTLFVVETLQAFTARHFSITAPSEDWKEVKQKEDLPSDDPYYIQWDIDNAISEPPLGKNACKFLFFPEEEVEFENKHEDITVNISFWPVALWEHIGKNADQLGLSIRDTWLYIVQSAWVNIPTCDIKYFTENIEGKKFYCCSYVSDGKTSLGYISYTTRVNCFYLTEDLKHEVFMSLGHLDRESALDDDVLINMAKDFMKNSEVVKADKDEDLLDYAIYSAESLYYGLRQRFTYDTRDKQLLHIAKMPININEDGVVKRRILKDDFHDIREHPIEKRIQQTIDLLNEAGKIYKNDPRIYFAIGLLSEFNAYGERYGSGFNKNAVKDAYLKAVSCDSSFSPANYNLAVLYIREGDIDKGISILNKILTGENGKDIETCCVLAYAYEKKGDISQAVEYYQSALSNFSGLEKKAAEEEYKKIKEKIKQLKK